jgi:hypothetical protein
MNGYDLVTRSRHDEMLRDNAVYLLTRLADTSDIVLVRD